MNVIMEILSGRLRQSAFKFHIITSILGLSLFLSGCGTPRIKGGNSNHISPTGTTTLVQSQDPKKASESITSSKISRDYYIPANSIVEIVKSNEPPIIVRLTTNMIIKEMIEDNARIRLGESNKNTAQEISTMLSGMQPVMFCGIALLLFGLATFHPKLKVLLQTSTTQSMIIILGGLSLIFLPMIFIQHGVLIIVLTVVGVLGYIFIYRYSKSSTTAKIYKDFIDLNNNKIDDRHE